jgi:hypothetical protein
VCLGKGRVKSRQGKKGGREEARGLCVSVYRKEKGKRVVQAMQVNTGGGIKKKRKDQDETTHVLACMTKQQKQSQLPLSEGPVKVKRQKETHQGQVSSIKNKLHIAFPLLLLCSFPL